MNTSHVVAGLLSVTLVTTAAAQPPQKVGRALVTFYWMIDESAPRYRNHREVPLRDRRGRVIALTNRRFEHDLVREGTGCLDDGRTVMYDGEVHGVRHFRVATCRYGLASDGCALDPYRTVAVDPHFVKPGSTIYIPQLKGARLPDGTIHDGIFIAADRGHFRGKHIDIFVGAGPRSARPFIRKGYGSRSHVSVYLVSAGGRRCQS